VRRTVNMIIIFRYEKKNTVSTREKNHHVCILNITNNILFIIMVTYRATAVWIANNDGDNARGRTDRREQRHCSDGWGKDGDAAVIVPSTAAGAREFLNSANGRLQT